jgi:cadmium resistance protein CadD (predicted permease)
LFISLSGFSILAGIWWIFLPLGMIQFLGLFPVILGLAAINRRVERKRGKIK